ncbi:DUF2961 domain-containing protein [bacterium]|nr:DUF2961 domain-containing protein [bacterium]
MRRPSAPSDPDAVFRRAGGRVRRAQICERQGKWVALAPGQSRDLTLSGAGVLRRIWCVFNAAGTAAEAMAALCAHRSLYQNIWLHIAFDDADVVQVSAPVADFFLCGHGDLEDVDCRYFQSVRIPPLDAPPYQAALNCFAPMPFAQQAKISFVNRNPFPVRLIASFDWLERADLEPPVLHFHATYTHKRSHRGPLVLLDARDVEGQYVGVGLYVHNREATHRWHEPAEFFAIDDTQPLVGTGVEDYFCLAWGFRRRLSRERFGVTCMRPHGGSPTLEGGGFNPAGEYAMYRFHADDPVPFERSLRLSLGAAGAARAARAAEVPPLEFRSVAYWYGRRLP